MVKIGNDWDEYLAEEWAKPYYADLKNFLLSEYSSETVYPPADDIYNALRLTPYNSVKAVILGQDPYHEPGQAQGLSFSVPYDVEYPPSLVNIFKELEADLGVSIRSDSRGNGITSDHADGSSDTTHCRNAVLRPWAEQGVLLLNTVLTVRAHQAGSHRGRGWETFTDRVIELLAERQQPMVFILWGANAGKKKDLIRNAEQNTGKLRHLIIQAPHPSPLSAYRGFFGGRYFSRCNYFLEDNGIAPVDWAI